MEKTAPCGRRVTIIIAVINPLPIADIRSAGARSERLDGLTG